MTYPEFLPSLTTAPDAFPLGTTVVTWSATDNHHNTISAEQTITVVDTTVPTIITPQEHCKRSS